MKYTDVVKFMKQAASEFDDAIEKERQRRLQISQGDPKIEAMFDAGARERVAKSQANRLADNAMADKFKARQIADRNALAIKTRKGLATVDAMDAKAKARIANEGNPTVRPDTLHASSSTAGRRTGAAEAARVKANREFAVRDAQRQDAALRNGTLQTRGSGSSDNLSYGQPIQRDANGQNIGRQPAAGAKVVSQYMINGMVYDRMSDGSTRQNQQMTEDYATTGVRPQLMKAQQPAARRLASKPQARPAANTTARPATTTGQVGSKPAVGSQPHVGTTTNVPTPQARTRTTIRTNVPRR